MISKAEGSNLSNSISTNDNDKDKEYNHLQKEKEYLYSIMPNSIFLPPKERLLSILKNDADIRQWYSEWLGDLINYQNKTLNSVRAIGQ